MSDLTSSNNHSYISHHRLNHKNVPLWVLANAMTFGEISKMYALLQQSMQSSISKNFDGVMWQDLTKMLDSMTCYRNICAHGERLYSHRIKNSIPDTDIHKRMNIPQKGQAYIFGKNDLFAVVIMFKYLLYPEDFTEFISKLKKVTQQYIANPCGLSEFELHEKMGFPKNWYDILQQC